MSQLRPLLESYRSSRAQDDARFAQSTWHWIGDTPEPKSSALASIVAPLGYRPDAVGRFIPLMLPDAAVWLPMLARSEIVHSQAVRPSDASIAEAAHALQELGPDLHLYSNGVIETAGHGREWELARAFGEWLRDDTYKIHFGSNAWREDQTPIADGYVLHIGIVGIGLDTSFCFWVMGDD